METKIEFYKDNLSVVILQDRKALGEKAADHAEKILIAKLKIKDELRVVFAAAPSQNEMLDSLTKKKTIDWSRITAFHMDEYIGLPQKSPQLFSQYLQNNIFSKVNFKNVHIINSQTVDIQKECDRYAELLQEKEIDLVCMGIGENGHIAFNDPPVADFNDPKVVKVVLLDDMCRQQQVNDGCFESFRDVPKSAITLTIPTLFSAQALSVVVPGTSKAEAVKQSIVDAISIQCPASILRRHKNAKLFIDQDAYSLLKDVKKQQPESLESVKEL
ncbi:MAG: glucosamine-6-phosphate deaminase [Bacteroidota bacterium]|nr:glucosamine-6-phosphate deaminase [Bacteroidota bacterium]